MVVVLPLPLMRLIAYLLKEGCLVYGRCSHFLTLFPAIVPLRPLTVLRCTPALAAPDLPRAPVLMRLPASVGMSTSYPYPVGFSVHEAHCLPIVLAQDSFATWAHAKPVRVISVHRPWVLGLHGWCTTYDVGVVASDHVVSTLIRPADFMNW